jgi:hypothetical protein
MAGLRSRDSVVPNFGVALETEFNATERHEQRCEIMARLIKLK